MVETAPEISTLTVTRRFLFALCLVSAGTFGANLNLDPGNSRVAFTYQQMGAPSEGEFKRFAARVSFDAARPAVSQVLFTLDIAGVDAGLAEVNEELQRPAFFDAGKFPQARFESTQITPLANLAYDIAGQLTLKGITRPIRSRAHIHADGAAYQVSGTFNFKRLDFGIGTGNWRDESILGNDIRVSYALRLLPTPIAQPPEKSR